MIPMKCIACERETRITYKRGEIEAAFCHYHYPMERKKIEILITVKCD